MSRFRNILVTVALNTIKFCYGFLFGTLIWLIVVEPYKRYYDFTFGFYWPELVFSLSVSFVFLTHQTSRCVIMLFLPSMIGSATQNYIIMLLLSGLLSGPIANVGMNAIESTRVIGCSTTMAFDQLSERAKLIFNPLIDILDQEAHDISSNVINNHMAVIKQTIGDMSKQIRPQDWRGKSSIHNDDDYHLEQMKKPLSGISFGLAGATSSLNASLNIELAENHTISQKIANFNTQQRGQANLTEILYQNCLNIFRSARSGCDEVNSSLKEKCIEEVGTSLAKIWCEPLFSSINSICPSVLQQLVGEKSLCEKMLDPSFRKIDQDNPFGLIDDPNWVESRNNSTSPLDINDIYTELNKRLNELRLDDYLAGDSNNETSSSDHMPRRIELNVGLNSKASEVFRETSRMVDYIKEKYALRVYVVRFILLAYDLYTTYTFVLIMIHAHRYRLAYLTQIKFDNHYITSEFVKMDREKKLRGVLPLDEEESQKYITAFTCKQRTKEERRQQRTSLTAILMFLATSFGLMYIDDILYSVLDSIHQHALIHYHEIGHHLLDITIEGEGSLAQLLRRLTDKLNSVYAMDRVTSTMVCLPEPKRTTGSYYAMFIGLVVLYCVIDQIGIYAMRLRRLTCALFYPIQERKRLEYLRKLIQYQRKKSLSRPSSVESY